MSLSITQIAAIKALVDTLAELDMAPLHLRVDAKRVGDPRPDISLWTQTRTDFEALCYRLGVKPAERRYSPEGQREWHGEHDMPDRRLLIQCVSFAHHEDWKPRPRPEVQGSRLDEVAT